MRYDKVDEKDPIAVERKRPYEVTSIIIVFVLVTMLLTTSILTAGFLSAKGYDGPERVALSTTFSTGSGTAEDPYMIYNVYDLQNMSKDLNAHYALLNDIDADETSMWNDGAGFEPVGNNSNPFTGSFDGQNHNIIGLYIYRPNTDYVGLFGYVGDGGEVRNVGGIDAYVIGGNIVGGILGLIYNGMVDNSYATGIVGGNSHVGGLVGSNTGMVSNSYATGDVYGTSFLGGLVGQNNNGTVENSYAAGDVFGEWGESRVGGLVGDNSGTVSNSFYNIDSVLINYGHHVTIGGLFNAQYQDWYNGNLNLNMSYYSETLIPVDDHYEISDVQGIRDLLGFAWDDSYSFRLSTDIDLSTVPGLYIPYLCAEFNGNNHTFSNLFIDMPFAVAVHLGMFGYVGEGGKVINVGVVDADVSGDWYVGGLVGWNEGTVSNSYATGTVSGDSDVGGLVGRNDGTVSNSYATGNVSGDSDVGGLVGLNDGTVSNSYATGNVSGDWYVGGLVGWNEGTVSNSYATGTVSGSRVGGLVGWNEGTVSYSYANGNVNGLGGYRDVVGGLVGQNQGTVSNSYSTVDVSGSDVIGGLVGRNEGTVLNSYANGNIVITDHHSSFVGGLVGFNSGTVVASFYHVGMPKCAADGDGSLRLNEYEFNSISTFEFAGWDIEMVDTERDYPFLSYEVGGSDTTWYIQYTEKLFNLTIQVEGNGSVYPPEGIHTYYEHAKISIEATPDDGYYSRWSGDVVSIVPAFTLTIDRDMIITVTFKEIHHEISNWEQLNNIRYSMGEDYVLISDLDETREGYDEYVNTMEGWLPIGDNKNPFRGSFDGNGHTISNLSITQPDKSYLGLFGYMDELGTLKNICLKDVNLTGNNIIGGLVGFNRGRVNTSSVHGYIEGNNQIGGLLGKNEGVVFESMSDVKVEGLRFVGGLVGINEGTIEYSYSKGDVKVEGYQTTNSNIYSAVNKNYVHNTYVEHTDSIQIPVVLVPAPPTPGIGGLVGTNTGKVSNSYASGPVSGDDRVGGLVGYNSRMVSNSYATGDVSGNGDVGGLVGYNYYGTVSNSYAAGDVDGNDNVGGLVGRNSGGTVENSFWDMDKSRTNVSDGGIGKTTVEMKTQSTFTDADWDFNNTWWMLENITYPLLTWQEISPPIVYIHSPTEGDIYTDKNVSVEWEGTHDILGISHYEIRLNEGDWINVGTDTRYTFEDLEDGEYTVTVKAVDNLGNEAMTSVPFTIDTGTSLLWWVFLVAIVAMVIAAILLFVKKRRVPIPYDRGDK